VTITEFQPIPREFPPAKLYLDDVEEIVKVFTDAADLSASDGEQDLRVSFGVKNFTCDTIEELQRFGPKAYVLGIYVDLNKQEVGSLEIVKGRPASWRNGPAMRAGDRFKVYGQLHALFHTRKIRWKYAVLSTPPWLLLSFILPASIPMVHDTLGNAEFVHQSHFYLKLTGFIALWVLSCCLSSYLPPFPWCTTHWAMPSSFISHTSI
jgi:hypothetical protein